MDGFLGKDAQFWSSMLPILGGAVALLAIIIAVVARVLKKATVEDLVAKKDYSGAGALALEQGKLDQAFDLFVRSQELGRAAQVALRLGRAKQAGELFEQAGDLKRAASAYREAGLTRQAEDVERTAAFNDARRRGPQGAAQGGARNPEAAPAAQAPASDPNGKLVELERAFYEARRLARGGDAAAAATLAEKGEEVGAAWLGIGEIERAAEVYRDAGLIDQAVNLYVNLLGRPGEAAAILSAAGAHDRAAELYEVAGQRERALDAWVSWSAEATDPFERIDSVRRLGNDIVGQYVAQAVEARPLSQQNASLHYRGAQILESVGEVDRAAVVLRTVQTYVPEARVLLQRVEQVISQRAVAAPLDPASLPLPSLPPSGGTGTRGSSPAAPAPAPLAQAELEDMLNEVVGRAARDAVRRELESASQVGDGTERMRGKARGVERMSIDLRFGMDSAVKAARHGPSIEALEQALEGQRCHRGNVDQFYALGLAQMAGGRWADARDTFRTVERAAPGFRDANARAAEVDAWRTALGVKTAAPGAPAEEPRAGRYALLGELGRGGMAVVYRARDESLGREVALKFISESVSNAELAFEYFQREARAAASLSHPNIVVIHDFGELDGRPYMAMELVEGTTVDVLLEQTRPLPIVDTLQIITQVLSALEYAHGRKIIHRDIKPANFMRLHSGLVKLMDFGLAKSMDTQAKQTIVAGTPPYMAPEQLAGRNNDPRSDIFAIGVSLYDMLTGELPFEGLSRDKKPRPLRELNPHVPALLESVVHRALELDADARWQTAHDMLAVLQKMLAKASGFLEQHGASLKSTPPPRPDGAVAGTAEKTAAVKRSDVKPGLAHAQTQASVAGPGVYFKNKNEG